MILLLLTGSCSEKFKKDDIEYFSTQEEALEHFIDNENIKGHIDLITTKKHELLLVTESSQNTYFVGELKEDSEGVYAVRISDSVLMEIGASWELITVDRNEYTIFFEKTNEKPYLIKLSNDEYFISIVEGHTISDKSLSLTDAIKEVGTIKNN